SDLTDILPQIEGSVAALCIPDRDSSRSKGDVDVSPGHCRIVNDDVSVRGSPDAESAWPQMDRLPEVSLLISNKNHDRQRLLNLTKSEPLRPFVCRLFHEMHV